MALVDLRGLGAEDELVGFQRELAGGVDRGAAHGQKATFAVGCGGRDADVGAVEGTAHQTPLLALVDIGALGADAGAGSRHQVSVPRFSFFW